MKKTPFHCLQIPALRRARRARHAQHAQHAKSALIGASIASLIGCTGDLPDTLLGAPAPTSRGRALFAEIEADLVKACGSCHDAGGFADTPFLRGPDRYKSMVSWPDF